MAAAPPHPCLLPTLVQLLVGVAAVQSWSGLDWGDCQLLAVAAASAVAMPAWRHLAPDSYKASRWRPLAETTLRLYGTATPTAVACE